MYCSTLKKDEVISHCRQRRPPPPQQTNGYDCVIHTILYTECAVRKITLQFDPSRFQYVRKKMLYMVLRCNTMILPMQELYGSGIAAADAIQERLTLGNAKKKSKPQPIPKEEELTNKQIEKKAQKWIERYKDSSKKVERMANPVIQKKLKNSWTRRRQRRKRQICST